MSTGILFSWIFSRLSASTGNGLMTIPFPNLYFFFDELLAVGDWDLAFYYLPLGYGDSYYCRGMDFLYGCLCSTFCGV